MTITLNDASSLFYLHIIGRFFTTLVISLSLACMVVLRDLGVSKEVVLEEFEFNSGNHIRMSWLHDGYDELVQAKMYEVAAKMYMLHLVTCTLFTNKSDVYIDARYVWLFNSVDDTS